MDLSFLPEGVATQIYAYLPKVAAALLILFVGIWLANKISNAVVNRIGKDGKVDSTVAPFLRSFISVGLKILVLLAAASQLGVEVTSFLAILTALSFAIGLALQGSLGHFASGVLLLIFRPYKVGDLVTIGGGQTGTVTELQIFNTVLATLDNKRIIVPNGNVTSNVITNISGQGTIGVELTFGISYRADIDKAREIILQVGRECPYVLDVPAQGVVVASLGESSVNLATRPFANSENYWNAFFYMQEHVKKAFDQGGIAIPFPQMDVHIQNK